MGGSFRILRAFGIDLKLHFTFFLVILFGFLMGVRGGPVGVVLGIGFVLLLFTCVALHEFGHALVAQRLGIPVREIILLPIGGVAMLSRSPSKPRHELLIAIAGPLVNVAILLVLAPLLAVAAGGVGPAWDLFTERTGAIQRGVATGAPMLSLTLVSLIWVNGMLVAFNMIPAFPLDGGRVLRSLLWMRMPLARATRIAAQIGQAFALLMGVVGIATGNLGLIIIAIFVYFGAGAESRAVQGNTVLATRQVGDAYNKFALSLSIDDRVSRVIDYILTSYQPDFAVLQRGRFLGVVTRDEVLRWLEANNYDVYVTEVMREDVLRVDARLPLDEVVRRMQEGQQRVAAVFDGDVYLGLVSAEDIAEAQLVLTFLDRGPTSPVGTTRQIRPPRTAPADDPIV